MWMYEFLFSLLMLGTVAVSLFFYKRAAISYGIIDKPNSRSLHDIPTVRGGGAVILSTWLIASSIVLYLYPIADAVELLMAIFLLAVVGFVDDIQSLSAKVRFVIQILASLLVIHFFWPMSWWMAFLMLFGAVWAINHFNFMDGMDGFLVSQSIFLSLSYAYLFYHLNMPADYWMAVILGAASMGFLIWNFPPAKIFMGDVGSTALGLIFFIFAARASQVGGISMLSWVMLNGLFLFDATVTLIRRMIIGEKWYQPHRTHAYQRIRQSGVSVQRILLGQWIINALIAAICWKAYQHPDSISLMLMYEVVLLSVMYLRQEQKA